MIPKDATGSALELGRRVLAIEADAVRALIARLDERFLAAVSLILNCKRPRHRERHRQVRPHRAQDRLHDGEHRHAGLLRAPGRSEPRRPRHDRPRRRVHRHLELRRKRGAACDIVPLVKRRGAKLVAITGKPRLDAGAARPTCTSTPAWREEACPLNLAPTASTTAALALGDALAVALLDARGFSAADFARRHPRGQLPRQALASRRCCTSRTSCAAAPTCPKVPRAGHAQARRSSR